MKAVMFRVIVSIVFFVSVGVLYFTGDDEIKLSSKTEVSPGIEIASGFGVIKEDESAVADRSLKSKAEASIQRSKTDKAEDDSVANIDVSIFDGDDTVNVEHVGELLSKDGFDNALESLRKSDVRTEKAILIEQDVYQRFNDSLGRYSSIHNVSSACGDRFCLASITYSSKEQLQEYLKETLYSDGFPSQYIAQQVVTENSEDKLRVLFMKEPPKIYAGTIFIKGN